MAGDLRPVGVHAAAWLLRATSACIWRSRILCAALASALSTGHAGISLSHSMSVGIGPLAADDDFKELPDRVGDRPVVAVDEQKIALVVGLLGVSRQVDFANVFDREIGQVVEGRVAVVGGGHEDIVDVEQQATSGAVHERADEVGFAHRRFREDHVGRWVLEKDRPADRLLHLLDMAGDTGERGLGVGQWQQVVEVRGLVGRPGEMLGDECRLVAINKCLEASRDGSCRGAVVRRSTCKRREATPGSRDERGSGRHAADRPLPCSFQHGPRRSRAAGFSLSIAPRCSGFRLVPAIPETGKRRKARGRRESGALITRRACP